MAQQRIQINRGKQGNSQKPEELEDLDYGGQEARETSANAEGTLSDIDAVLAENEARPVSSGSNAGQEDALGARLSAPRSHQDQEGTDTTSDGLAAAAASTGSPGGTTHSGLTKTKTPVDKPPVGSNAKTLDASGNLNGGGSGKMGRAQKARSGIQGALSKFTGNRKNIAIAGGGVALIGLIIGLALAFLALFQIENIARLYTDYRFTQLHRVMRVRTLELLKEAETKAKGNADSKVNQTDPLEKQVENLDSKKVAQTLHGDGQLTGQEATRELNYKVKQAEVSSEGKSGRTYQIIDGIQRFVEKMKPQKNAEEAKVQAKADDHKAVQTDRPAHTGATADTEDKLQQKIDEGMSPEEAATNEEVVKSVKILGRAADVSMFVVLTTFYCIGRDIYDQATTKYEKIRAHSLIRTGARANSFADAQKSGLLTLQQVGAESQLLSDEDQNWTDTASYSEAARKPPRESDITIDPGSLPFGSSMGDLFQIMKVAFEAIPAALAGPACGFLLNPATQAAVAVGEGAAQAVGALITGGQSLTIQAILRATATNTVKAVLSKKGITTIGLIEASRFITVGIAASKAATNTTGTEGPAQKSLKIDAGDTLMAQQSAANLGGRVLKPEEASAQMALADEEWRIERSRQNVFARIFNINDPTTLGAHALSTAPTSPSAALRMTGSYLATVLNPPRLAAAFAGSIFHGSKNAQAAENENNGCNPYNIPCIGFTDEELARHPNILENSNYIEARPEIIEEYKECFDGVDIVDFVDKNSELYEKCNNADNDDLLRYRLYVMDKEIVCNVATTQNTCIRENPITEVEAGTALGAGTNWLSGNSGNTAGEAKVWESYRGSPVTAFDIFTARGSWGDIINPQYMWNNMSGFTGRLVIAVPFYPVGGGDMGTCANGGYNDKWNEFGTNMIKANRADSFVRVAWEFNGDWFPWSAKDPATWVRCFQQVSNAIRATNPQALIDWTMNAHGSQTCGGDPFKNCWPGDSYVSVVGIDSYDMYPRAPDQATWDAQCNGPQGLCSLQKFAEEHGKQFSVGEWGVVTCGGENNPGHAHEAKGDNPFYITQMYNFFFSHSNGTGPGTVAYETYFDDPGEGNVCASLWDPNQAPMSSDKYKELWAGGTGAAAVAP